MVTGAAGFIGSAIAQRLIQSGNDVVTIDNLSTGIRSNIPNGCIFISGNDYDEVILKQLEPYRFDAILHIAGQSSGEISFEDPVYDLQTNTQSTLLLLDIAIKTGCNKFIYASSMSVYGNPTPDFVTETSPTIPKSFYAVGKLASENYMRIFSEFGIQCTALRLFNVYGIGQNMNNLKQGMASIYLTMAIRNRHITVKGSKDRYRDFIHIDDVVDVIIKCLQRQTGESFEVYNVSSRQKQTVESIIHKIQAAMPFEVSVEYVQGTPGDQHGIYGDNQKLCSQINWKPKYNFEEGFQSMIQWALRQK